MRATLHPRYEPVAIRCAGCGAVYETRSTRAAYEVDVCVACHPFTSGVDRGPAGGGRVARFEARRARVRAV